MYVTDGEKIYNTDNMIVIDGDYYDERFGKKTEQILMSDSGEYFHFFNGNNVLRFTKTECNSLTDIEEWEEIEAIDDGCEMCNYDWFERCSYTELVEWGDYKSDELTKLAKDFDNDDNLDDFESKAKEIDEDFYFRDDDMEKIKRTKNAENDIDNIVYSSDNLTIYASKSDDGFWLSQEYNYAYLKSLSEDLVYSILVNQYANQKFDLSDIVILPEAKECLDESCNTKKNAA